MSRRNFDRKSRPSRRARSEMSLGGIGRSPRNPPMFRSNLIFSHKFRFSASAAFSAGISAPDVIACCGGIATTVAAITCWANSVRLKRIAVWAAPSTLGASATVSVNWIGNQNTPNTEVSDTSLSTAQNAHVSCVPPANSIASFWMNTASADLLFTLVVPQGGIVDLDLEIVLADQNSPPDVVVVATAVIGRTYYLALDQATAGTHVLVPVSLATTF